MKKITILLLTLMMTNSFVLTGCKEQNVLTNSNQESSSKMDDSIPINTEAFIINDQFKVLMGQIIYVPVYSHIYFLNKQKHYHLAATVSIHNTDLKESIIIKSVKFYDTKGQFLNEYLPQPVKLNPLASTDFFIEQNDTRGGVGANFLIEWVTDKKVSLPIVESVMLGTAGTQGVSFISTGRVIKEYQN